MNDIEEIIARIDEILINKEAERAYIVGGYIVGATIIRDDYEELSEKYPLFAIIAELGADLETLDGDMATEVLQQVKTAFEALKTQINTSLIDLN